MQGFEFQCKAIYLYFRKECPQNYWAFALNKCVLVHFEMGNSLIVHTLPAAEIQGHQLGKLKFTYRTDKLTAN